MSNAFDDVNRHQEGFQGVHSFDLFSLPAHKFLQFLIGLLQHSSKKKKKKKKKSQLQTLRHEILAGKLGQLIQTSTELFGCYD